MPHIAEGGGRSGLEQLELDPDESGSTAEAGVPLLKLEKMGPRSRMPTAQSAISAREVRERVHTSRLGNLTSRELRTPVYPLSFGEGKDAVISSVQVLREVKLAREKGLPSQVAPRYGLNIQFKSSEDLTNAVKPRPSSRLPVDDSHFLPDDDRYVTSYMVARQVPAAEGRERVRGVEDDKKHMKQHANHVRNGLAGKERVLNEYNARDEKVDARKENRVNIRAEMREEREGRLKQEKPRPDDFDARRRAEVNRFHMSPDAEKHRLEKKFKPYDGVEVHHNQEGSWSPGKEITMLQAASPRKRPAIRRELDEGKGQPGARRRFFDDEPQEGRRLSKAEGHAALARAIREGGKDAVELHAGGAGGTTGMDGEDMGAWKGRRRRNEEAFEQVASLREAKQVAKMVALRSQRERYEGAIQNQGAREDQDEIFKLNKLRRHKKRWEASLDKEEVVRNAKLQGAQSLDKIAEQQRKYHEDIMLEREKKEQHDSQRRLALKVQQQRHSEYSHDMQVKKDNHERDVLHTVARQQESHREFAKERQLRGEAMKCKADNAQITAESCPIPVVKPALGLKDKASGIRAIALEPKANGGHPWLQQ